jgi:hypothetical protein
MGLDMYLSRRVYVGSYKDSTELQITGLPEYAKLSDSDMAKVKYIELEAGYWRKSNQIHKWFVDNVQGGNDDCGHYYVGEEKLQELLDLVNECLKNRDQAPQLLPPQDGFFFGGTEIGDWYWQDLESTKEILESALKDGGEFMYHSSW